ncbi:MAG: phosphoribosylformylglycinamidine cyclo-ligase [Desulfobulbus propionicus]|nr:MAG: phosphoribosylformylglycinamidine cyclo-ligase [Desulfobulbus propionicus]
MIQSPSRYREAGVDIDKGNAFVERIKGLVSETHRPGVLTDIGGFSGLFAIGDKGYKNPVLVASTDGVGTKLAVAKLCGRHDTIGIDLVAMCANDVVVSGATPLFFLDYFSTGSLDMEVAADVVKGIAQGCKLARCALIGGETAEMPGLYQPGEYDLAGFIVGIGERDNLIDGSTVQAGDQIIGLPSSGIHSNGYSLVRKVLFEEQGLDPDASIEELGCTLGEELLRPTKIYVDSLTTLTRRHTIKALVHITGGGFFDNIPRVLPDGCGAVLNPAAWSRPPIFTLLKERGKISETEMYRTFNMGIGMVAIVAAEVAEEVLLQLKDLGEEALLIGEISETQGSQPQVVLEGVA